MSQLTAVAMSGGLDSSTVAWLLADGGRPIVGLSMLLWDRSQQATHGRCCGALDLGDARRVAEQCGIPHYTLEMEEEFRRHVVDPFVDSYLEGRTPVPCTRCNTFIKFDLLMERARRLGAERLATGHYARIRSGPDGPELHAAAMEEKDQSYYLFELTQEQLARTEFPLGAMSKSEVRELARSAGLSVAEKGESMELCFVAEGVREFVESEAVERPEWSAVTHAGGATIRDRRGQRLGEGEPYYRYTVGQRRGLGVSAGERLYVIGLDPEQNRVTVGGRDELSSPGLIGEGVHWIGPRPGGAVEATVRIRSRHAGVAARIESRGESGCRVEFAMPQEAVTPGQAAVFYDGTRVLGGCWIHEAM